MNEESGELVKNNEEMVNLVLLNEGDSPIGRKIQQWFKGLTIICTNSSNGFFAC